MCYDNWFIFQNSPVLGANRKDGGLNAMPITRKIINKLRKEGD